MAAGRYREAIAHLQALPRKDLWWPARLAACLPAIGDTAAAAQGMSDAEAIRPGWNPFTDFRRGGEFEHTGDTDRILHDFALAVEAHRSHGQRSGKT